MALPRPASPSGHHRLRCAETSSISDSGPSSLHLPARSAPHSRGNNGDPVAAARRTGPCPMNIHNGSRLNGSCMLLWEMSGGTLRQWLRKLAITFTQKHFGPVCLSQLLSCAVRASCHEAHAHSNYIAG